MIVLPPGDFVQGAPAGTAGSEPFESPEHDVFIDHAFAASQHEVTVGEFAEFVEATGRQVEGCWTYDGAWRLDSATSWKSAIEGQTALHPASCVSWDDANAYTQWLSQRTSQPYRLPSAAEWEFAARGGSSAARPWTSDAAALQSGERGRSDGPAALPGLDDARVHGHVRAIGAGGIVRRQRASDCTTRSATYSNGSPTAGTTTTPARPTTAPHESTATARSMKRAAARGSRRRTSCGSRIATALPRTIAAPASAFAS